MARFRSSARKAPRFTGQQFGSGFQYNTPEPFEIELGPFTDFVPNVSVDAPKGYINDLKYAKIQNGSIYPLLGAYASASTVTGGKTYYCINAFVFTIGSVEYEIGIMFNDTDDDIAIYHNGTYTSFPAVPKVSAGMTNADPTAFAVQWGKFVYFGSPFFNGFYKYDPVANTVTAVAGFVNPMYDIFVLNNNMCVVEYDATNQDYTLSWSVDGSPEDFTSAGAGSNIFFKPYRRAVISNDAGYLFFATGAVRMDPTGTLPAFRFSDIANISGARSPSGVVLAGDKLAYIAVDGRLKIYDGSETDIQSGLPTLRTSGLAGTPVFLFYIPAVKWLVIGDSSTYYFFDENFKLIHSLNGNWIAMVSGASGPFVLWARSGKTRETYALYAFTGDGSTTPTITLPKINFGKSIMMDYVEIYSNSAGANTQLNLVYTPDSGNSTSYTTVVIPGTSSFTKQTGYSTIYPVHRNMRAVSLVVFPANGVIVANIKLYGHKERINDGS